MTLLQVGFVLTHRPAANENMALQALHGTAYGHDHRVDLHRYLTCWSQHKNLQEGKVSKMKKTKTLILDWEKIKDEQ